MIHFSQEKVLLHKILAEVTGSGVGVRDEALMESALVATYAGFREKKYYPTKEEKGARLGFGLKIEDAFIIQLTFEVK